MALKLLWCSLLCLLLTACQPPALVVTATASPASSSTPTPSVTPSPTSTATVTTTPTQTATPTQTPTITPTPEPRGCLPPPDDYTRLRVNGWVLNQRTLTMLQHAAEIYGGEIDLAGEAITQGSYHDNGAASFGTHLGGGAVDLSVMKPGTWQVMWEDMDRLIYALRAAGFAAWLRELDELYPGSSYHIHAIAIGDQELSQAAQAQLTGEHGYFAGLNGIPYAVAPDKHGGPVLCQWMIDAGYRDVRATTNTPQP